MMIHGVPIRAGTGLPIAAAVSFSAESQADIPTAMASINPNPPPAASARCQPLSGPGRVAHVRAAPARVKRGPFPTRVAGSGMSAGIACQAAIHPPRAPIAAINAKPPRTRCAMTVSRAAHGSNKAGTPTRRTMNPQRSRPCASGDAPHGNITPSTISPGPSICNPSGNVFSSFEFTIPPRS